MRGRADMHGHMLSRRDLLRSGLAGAGALALGPTFWQEALSASAAVPGPGPYGPLAGADVRGLRLPAGFRSRLIAQGNVPVPGTAYTWHVFSDGQATFATDDGGFVLVSNSEAPATFGGGASAIRFDADGHSRDAYRILDGTDINCAGGRTPWATWLSCEEVDRGRVWECDPFGRAPAVPRPAMGVFKHEAATVDPDDQRVYLTEDVADGCLYRFTPEHYPSLASGLLELAVVEPGGGVSWKPVPDPSAALMPTRSQVVGATRFERGEGIWFDSGVVYVATTRDSRIHAYDTLTKTIEVLYDANASNGPLRNVDNLTVSVAGDLFVCEDGDDLQICVISREREVAPFLQLTGQAHAGSELTGVVFDPSGSRLFLSSQRGHGPGAIYEVAGPFRDERRPQQVYPPMRVARPMRVEVQESIRLQVLLGRGLPVRVEVEGATGLALTLGSARTRRRGRRIEPLAPARRWTFARRRRRLTSGGRLKIWLRPGPNARRALRRRRITRLLVTVVARDAFGNRRRIVAHVVLRRPRGRHRERRRRRLSSGG